MKSLSPLPKANSKRVRAESEHKNVNNCILCSESLQLMVDQARGDAEGRKVESEVHTDYILQCDATQRRHLL